MLLKDIDYLVTQNPDREILEDVDVLVRDGEIAAIGRDISADGEVIDCSGKAVIPGLVNAHTHAPMTLLRGISDDKPLQDWLKEDIFPAEEKLDEEDAFVGALLACSEMLKTGTTCFNEMYFHVDAVAKAVKTAGVRAVIGRGLTDIDGGKEEKMEQAQGFIERNLDSSLVTPSVAPHSVYTCSDELLVEAKQLAERYGLLYHIHVSETRRENLEFRVEEGGPTPVQYLYREGLLDGNTVLAHGTHLSGEDRQLVAESGAGVAHNPAANLKLGSGVAGVAEMVEDGIGVGIGTDGAASNNSMNLFEEAKIASLLQKERDPGKLPAQEVLDMLTIDGAQMLGLAGEIGSIEPGKKADLVTVSLDRPGMTPRHGKKGLLSDLVFSFNGEVEDVLVDGRQVVREGEILGLDTRKLSEMAQKKAEELSPGQ
ncbi:MAG: amidohydrolase [Candidatus Nanohaloarchaea archaeon]